LELYLAEIMGAETSMTVACCQLPDETGSYLKEFSMTNIPFSIFCLRSVIKLIKKINKTNIHPATESHRMNKQIKI
jgi:hypothetical protein